MLDTFLIALSTLFLGLTLGYLLGRRSASRGRSSPNPFRSGLLAGGVFAVAVGAVFWLSQADFQGSGDEPRPAAAVPSPPHEATEPLSPALAARDQHLIANPDDLEARKEMALMLIAEERHMDALGQADRILERSPGDPTALYVQGVVRLTMGQRDSGKALLEQALSSDPGHMHSLIALGTVNLQDGDGDAAVAVLERALAAAGGRHEGIEAKLAEARAMSPGS